MESNDAPDTVPADLELLVAEYLDQLEGSGPEPSLEDYVARAGAHATAFRTMVQDARTASSALPRVLSEGTRINARYRIEREIGEGGMGRVFRAFDESLQRHVAVKVLAGLAAGDPEREELLLKESRMLAGLHHPGIVAVHESGRDGEWVYIVMDLVEGKSLNDVIERSRTLLQRMTGGGETLPRRGETLREAIDHALPPGRTDLIQDRSWYRSVASLVLEIARTLEAAHGTGVVHRDMKPSNVMILGGGHPVVLDFGLAGSTEWASGEVTEGLYGTVAYLAPEQAENQRVGTDPRTDVYQMGLILYELLTLRRAFPGKSTFPVMEKIRKGDFPRPRTLDKECPIELEAVCLMAMELSPDKRYANARELREDLERYLGDGELPRAMDGYRGRRFARALRLKLKKYPMLFGVAATALAALALLPLLGGGDAVSVKHWKAVASDTSRLFQVFSGSPVDNGNVLGVEVDTDRELAVFALSIWGDGELHERRVAPMRPVRLEEFRPGEAVYGPRGLELDPGMHNVICAGIQYKDGDDWPLYEGVLVALAEEGQGTLDRWMETLEERGPVNLGEALRILEQSEFVPRKGELLDDEGEPIGLRGVTIGEMPEGTRRAMSQIGERAAKGELVLEVPGARIELIEYRLVQPR